MSLPATNRTYRRTADGNSIELLEEPLSQDLKANEALIKIHAVSLNFRDIAMISGATQSKSSSKALRAPMLQQPL